ncbi:maltase 1-like [Belonocnema kinseyi]|uniref:maltase 1-like n=1 Tax=Belonocnema kinseyi TaxID=2817044 RepID=UPI00143D8324|nr:maltase 1-like [Belonocnema kinseyi]
MLGFTEVTFEDFIDSDTNVIIAIEPTDSEILDSIKAQEPSKSDDENDAEDQGLAAPTKLKDAECPWHGLGECNTDVDRQYGTLSDFSNLVSQANFLDLKVLLDFVPNHSSDQHPWFKNSIKKIKPYDEFYIWKNGTTVDGVRQPPNNWLSVFKGSAWTWNEEIGQYYYHQFAPGQPDLNFRNKDLVQALKDALTFWMDRGVDGFRVDVILDLFEDEQLHDEPKSNTSNVPEDEYLYLNHIYTKDQEEIYGVAQGWRALLDDHAKKHNEDTKLLIVETSGTPSTIQKYFEVGSNAFNFLLLNYLGASSTAIDFKKFIDNLPNNVLEANVSIWVTDNHENHRSGSRFGITKSDMLAMLAMTLPGITVVLIEI